MEREPLGQALNHVMGVFVVMSGMVRKDHEYDEVAAEKETLKHIVLMANLLLSIIDETEKRQFGVLRKIRHHS